MAVMAKSEARSLTLRQQEGRAVNAVAEMLRKRLSVPNIYLEPPSSLIAADVLAVDRAGAGDLHAVTIKLQVEFVNTRPSGADDPRAGWMSQMRKRKVREMRDHLMSLPAHYRYLAIPHSSWDIVMKELGPLLYSADGIGRVGIITITDRGQDPPTAELSIAPERFRVDAVKLGNVEKKLLQKIRPDIEVRI
jgi:hypothetical protein